MVSYFRAVKRMENYQGDLADIVRAGGGPITGGSFSGSKVPPKVDPNTEWQFPAVNYPNSEEFGDPFSNLRDPLLHELHMPVSCLSSCSDSGSGSGSTNLFNKNSTEMLMMMMKPTSSVEGTNIFSSKNHVDGEMRSNSTNNSNHNIFTRMLQISPNAKLPISNDHVVKASPLVPSDVISAAVNTTSKATCFVEQNAGGTLQISSPRNTGIKRRKSQAKKVVCIPAPAPANSRPSGEVVPSDLWAWRKYGQKPIKGSPYPRGYYRCSSSKGCSARKQVERSRTDPNMLVITYTSEHNHPWPTQRNALAGSTRSQPSSKTNSSSKNSPAATSHPQKGSALSIKEEEEEHQPNNTSDSVISSPITTANSITAVKEEMEDLEKQMEMDDHDHDHGDEFNECFPQSYRPQLPDMSSNNHSEDFFADLGEIGDDPLSLLFTQGFSADEERENKSLDAFNSFFDWTENNNINNNNTPFGETKRGL